MGQKDVTLYRYSDSSRLMIGLCEIFRRLCHVGVRRHMQRAERFALMLVVHWIKS